MKNKILFINLLLIAALSIFGIEVYASSDYNNSLSKIKQVCENYSRYRLSLDRSTYLSTRGSDYDKLEQKLHNLGATDVNEKASNIDRNYRCIWITFRYKNNSYDTKYCK